MKKLFIFFVLLAGIAVMTGCQKDKDVVTLKAVMGQDTKAYFGNESLNLPYWDADDEVFVSGQSSSNTFSNTFGLTSPNTTFATITNVPACDVYCAIFPSRIVQSMGTPSASGTTASIYYDPHQFYQWDATNSRQRVDMPMGAVTTDETLIFKNLCSILRLNVSNSLTNIDFDVMRLTVQAFDAYIAGYFNVTLSENGDPAIDLTTPHQSHDNVLSVYDVNHQSMGTIYKNTTSGPTSKSFDIIVPPFNNATALVLEVEMYKHNADGSSTPLGYYEYRINNQVSLARNKIIPINLNVNSYTNFDYAYLESGPDFNADIKTLIRNHSNVNAIMFNIVPGELTQISEANEWVEGSTPSGWVELQADYSPRKIYGYVSGNSVIINSFATSIYAHSNCSTMFKDLTNIVNIQTSQTQLFNTEDVTDMSYMFAGCTNLNILEGISFNTTNVTTMAHMFEGCSAMTGLELPFNTHHLRGDGMVAMFKNCSGLQTLTLNLFTTEQITDMSELFYGCTNMGQLNINRFVISNNTTLTNMCTNLAFSHTPYWRCTISCTGDVQTALLKRQFVATNDDGNITYYSDVNDEDNDPNTLYYYYITGIDPTKVSFSLQEGSAK